MCIIVCEGVLLMKKKLAAAAILLIALCLCIVKPAAVTEADAPSKEAHSAPESSGGESSKDGMIQEIIGGGNRTEAGAE